MLTMTFCTYFIILCITIMSCSCHRKLPPVVFSSHDRGPHGNQWMFTSLTSLLLSTNTSMKPPEIHIMIGGMDSFYLDNIKHHTNIYIHPLDTKKIKGWNRKERNWKGGWNYLRCLNASTEEGVLIIEDDVVFSHKLWSKFQETLSQIEKQFPGEQYLLDLYARFPGQKPEKGILYSKKTKSFCCTQCMYYTKEAAAAVYKELYSNLQGVRKWGYDISIKHLLHKKEFPMFNSYPSLAQHIGITSSIGSVTFHKSNTFELGNEHATYEKSGAIRYSRLATHKLLKQKLELKNITTTFKL